MDPDQLALLALGESVELGNGPTVNGHLRQCGTCRGQLASLQTTVDLAREAVLHRDTPPPSEAVWSRIAAEAGIGTPPRLGQHRASEPSAGRTGRRWARPVAALLAAVVLGVLGTLGTLRPWQSHLPTPTSSAAELVPVPGGPGGARGRAVVERGPGGPVLRITAAGLPLQQGYFEVWVFDGRSSMVAIGVLGADSTASLPLPPTLDLRTFHVVDISQEEYDGNQTHSRLSVLRGSLTE